MEMVLVEWCEAGEPVNGDEVGGVTEAIGTTVG